MGDTEAERVISIELFIAALSFAGFLLTVTYSQMRSTERLARAGQDRLNSIAGNIPGGVVFQLRRTIAPGLRERRFAVNSTAHA